MVEFLADIHFLLSLAQDKTQPSDAVLPQGSVLTDDDATLEAPVGSMFR